MTHPIAAPRPDHIQSLRRALAQDPDAPLADLLSGDLLRQHLPDRDAPLYRPGTTLRLWVGQVLDADRSCHQAVARLAARRAEDGAPPCSGATGGYCKARRRLPEDGLRQLAVAAGAALHRRAPAAWLCHGRRVLIADGSTSTLADTPANQAAYPQPDGQAAGLGFPMLRMVVLLCLATGALLDLALAPYAGKGTGEVSLFRQLWHHLRPGDVLLADRVFCSWAEMAVLLGRGVDLILTKNRSRKTDFRTGVRLGPKDHLVRWPKPAKRPDWVDAAAWQALPAELVLREAEVLKRRGPKRPAVVAVSSLLDARAWPREAFREAHRRRWEGELDLRSIKGTLGMAELRCKSPALVRKEVWVYVLAYNLLRGHMAQAAARAGAAPRRLSLAGARQSWAAFGEGLARAPAGARPGLYGRFLDVVAAQRVGGRPGRVEPRAKKRRKKNYPILTEPREKARRRLRRAV